MKIWNIPAVFDFHLTATGVDMAIRATDGFGCLPADLLAVAGRLAELFRRLDNTLPTVIKSHKPS